MYVAIHNGNLVKAEEVQQCCGYQVDKIGAYFGVCIPGRDDKRCDTFCRTMTCINKGGYCRQLPHVSPPGFVCYCHC